MYDWALLQKWLTLKAVNHICKKSYIVNVWQGSKDAYKLHV